MDRFAFCDGRHSRAADARPYVEFDFARSAECRDVTPPERADQYPHQRLIEMTLPVSVRFRGVVADDVDELDIEINGSSAGLQVFDFSPDTQLASDVKRTIETTTTVKKDRSLDGSLGGVLPIPYSEAVAHVTPSINAAISRGEIETEKLHRLPPKYAVVVSGTSSEGRGVFFKLKRSSQTSLEGVHELAVTFVAPADWQDGKVLVGCSARGSRKLFWIDQPATLGRAVSEVELTMAGKAAPSKAIRYKVAKPPVDTPRRASLMETVTAEVTGLVGASSRGDRVIEPMETVGWVELRETHQYHLETHHEWWVSWNSTHPTSCSVTA